MSSPVILELQRLTRTFPSGARMLTVLKDVSFQIEQNATCAVLGPSGSGKTTLIGLSAGLDAPTSGRVILNGVCLNDLDEEGRARLRNEAVGFVFQNFQLIPTLTSLENVMVPLELRGEKAVRQPAAEWLERVGLEDRMDHYPTQLSGGEQQRVAMARAFISRPKILFADEPTGNLDAETSARVIDLMFELNRDEGTALMLVTHDLDLAHRTQRLIRLREGRLVEDQKIQAVSAK